MQYRPEVDGLRAIAIVPVILFHAGLAGFSGGYVGVDVFFVISGYLITTLILEEADHRRFGFLNFYERRIRRIAPTLGLVLVACIPFAWLWMLPEELAEFGKTRGFHVRVPVQLRFLGAVRLFRLGGRTQTFAAHLEPVGRGAVLPALPGHSAGAFQVQPEGAPVDSGGVSHA
jgi:peptidoglycan/LPS O-acetylase OafA/YrhL